MKATKEILLGNSLNIRNAPTPLGRRSLFVVYSVLLPESGRGGRGRLARNREDK